MKSILISIQPKWCELIASGKKMVEVRKTKPKLKTPFKCYIYATKPKHFYHISKQLLTSNESLFLINGKVKMCDGFGVEYEDPNYKHLNCKVIGEFVCDQIDEIGYSPEMHGKYISDIDDIHFVSCIDFEQMFEYLADGYGYAWHISDLVIYDKPRELSEFYTEGDCDCMNCKNCFWFDRGNGYNVEDDCYLAYKANNAHKSFKPITRPPQSWCYVESEKINYSLK